MPPFHLHFFVIGAQKCATSWLYYCLQDHPQIRVPQKKMEHGYLGGKTFHEKGEMWYFNRFPQLIGEAVNGDVAVDYMLDPTVPGQLLPYSNKPKFIVLLRHPVERMVSAYYWSIRRNQLPNLPLTAGLAPFLKQEPGFPERYENRYVDELARRGFYGEQLESYLHFFEPSQFMVILYNEVRQAPNEVIRRIYRHLGVDDNFLPSSLHSQPKKNTYNTTMMAFERLLKSQMQRKVADLAHRVLARLQTKPKSPSLPPEMRARLVELFRPHILQTQKLLHSLPLENRPANMDLIKLWN
jgi:hypothetical protein